MKSVFCLAFGLIAVVGCAVAPEEEQQATTQSEFQSTSRAAHGDECLLGDGLYCGQNGVDGAVNVLYRCGGDRIRSVELCVGPCTKMPDGINDRCDETAAVAETTLAAEAPQAEALPAQAPVCGIGLTCATTSTGGASRCRQSVSSTTDIHCCPVPGSLIVNDQCVAPAPYCGIGLYCALNAVGGGSACRQSANSTSSIYCCPSGKQIVNGTCV